jgi:hypothetical protein
LTAIVLILGFLLVTISYLCPVYGVHAMDETQPGYQSVLSQLTGTIVGWGAIYFIAIGSLLAVLCLSANTSFVDFTRLCRLVARDGYIGRALLRRQGVDWSIRSAYCGWRPLPDSCSRYSGGLPTG